jgi:glycosyltransferase involved in cell wall biosynthesis
MGWSVEYRENALPRIVVVADSAGHILERIGLSWARHAEGATHVVTVSWGRTSHTLTRLASRYDGVHWLDQLRFETCGPAVDRPQVLMVHHLVDRMHDTLLPRLRHADALAAVAESWRARLENLTGRRVELVPNSIDCSHFRPPTPAERQHARTRLEGRFVAGFVAKAEADHEGRKGVDLLLDVARAAARSWPDFTLLLVGPGWDALAAKLAALGVPATRRVYLRTLDTVQAYHAMDVLLVTARVEGGPCTTLEAMASGVPVVCSEVGHIPETIRDGVSGLVCRNREVREYLAALRALRDDRALREGVLNEARAFVARTRDEPVLVPKLPLADLYERADAVYRRRSQSELLARRLARARLLLRHIVHHAMRGRR